MNGMGVPHLSQEELRTVVILLPTMIEQMKISDTGDGCIIELVKFDGVEISFGVASSGYDGTLVQTNYFLKTTFKSYVYYMCT